MLLIKWVDKNKKMTNINLYQSPAEEKKTNESFFDGGFIISVVLILLVLMGFVGIKIANNRINARNLALASQIDLEKNGISGDEQMNEVVDFENRIEKMTENIQKADARLVLDNVAKEIVEGAVISEYDYAESGKISLKIQADNFQTVAKQILAFKKSAKFKGVATEDIKRGDKNIELSVSMMLADEKNK